MLQPLRELEEPILDLSGVLPYTALQQMFDPFFPAGEAHYWKSIYLAGLGDEAVDAIVAHVAVAALADVDGRPVGARRRARPCRADGDRHRRAQRTVRRRDPRQLDRPGTAAANIDWAQRLFEAMTPFSTGKTNLNFPGLGDDPGFVRAALGDNWDRLVEVKRTVRPDQPLPPQPEHRPLHDRLTLAELYAHVRAIGEAGRRDRSSLVVPDGSTGLSALFARMPPPCPDCRFARRGTCCRSWTPGRSHLRRYRTPGGSSLRRRRHRRTSAGRPRRTAMGHACAPGDFGLLL